MPQYLISVWHDDDYAENDWSDPDIQRRFARATFLSDNRADLEQEGPAGRAPGGT